MIKKDTIENFLSGLSSSAPTPGGGSAAAITGAIAAALVEMVCNLTSSKITYSDVAKTASEIAERMGEIKGELLELADKDSEAFDKVLIAYKSKDKEKIVNALQGAIDIPEKVKKLSLEVHDKAMQISDIGNKNAYSDALSAKHLAAAAAESAQENIDINESALAKLKS